MSGRWARVRVASLVAVALQLTTALADDAGDGEAVIRGAVTDSAGKPIAGATVLINKYEGAVLDPVGPTAKTNEAGKYELRVRMPAPVLVKQMWISKPGFVRFIKTDHFELKPRQAHSFDFKLQPGIMISGQVEEPFGFGMPKDVQAPFQVLGEDFELIDATEPGGKFEIYVPPGTYSIEVLTARNIKATNVAAGTKNLVLKAKPVAISPKVLAKAFDDMWHFMDEEYSYFAYKPGVDWNKLRDRYRPRAIAAKTKQEFIDQLLEMLTELQDMHIWIETEDGIVGTYGRQWQRNWNPKVIFQSLESSKECGQFAIVGKTKPDGFGLVVINKQGSATPENVRQTVDEILKLADAPGFIVDLRGGASGGSEPLAQTLAQAFCAKEVVYARHKYRNGPTHDSFGPERLRILPAGNHPYTKPVVCLIGERCMSSGEALVKMMRAQPNVTLVGMRTRGASGNPKPFELEGLNIRVKFSRWVDMQADGKVFEGVGISPDIEINVPAERYKNEDPTWERGLAVLREKIAAEKKRGSD